MKKQKMLLITTVMILISFAITTVISMISLDRVMDDDVVSMTKVTASGIYDAIEKELSQPIMVSETMANDIFLIHALEAEDDMTQEEMVDTFSEYLSRIKTQMGWDSAFVVSSQSGKYYSYDGLNKIVDPENDEHDIWYALFLESGLEYDLDVDVDEVNQNLWTVFINCRVEDEDGKLLGVCGVGVEMSNIQAVIQAYENNYEMKVNLIDTEGLVQVDTDSDNIENAYLGELIRDIPQNSGDYFYSKYEDNSCVVTKYVEDLGWYLVIRNSNSGRTAAYSDLLFSNLTAVGAVLLLLLITIRIVINRENRKLTSLAYTDRLTGVRNRNYIKAYIEDDQKEYPALAIFDVDKFKEINDTEGHLAGDEILKTVSRITEQMLGEKGTLIRWGGDEFVILFRTSFREAVARCENLRRAMEDAAGITISVGVHYYEGTLAQSLKRADSALYLAKKKGRNAVCIIENEGGSVL